MPDGSGASPVSECDAVSAPIRVLALSPIPEEGAGCRFRIAQFIPSLEAAGFDEICADQQHGAIDLHTIGPLFSAITGRGAIPTTRVASNDATAIGKSLDMGALGVIVPMVNTADEAAAIVAACRYPPNGIRSAAPRARSIPSGSISTIWPGLPPSR